VLLGITWTGLLCAATGQLLAVALVVIRCDLSRGSGLRVITCVAAADIPICLFLGAMPHRDKAPGVTPAL
jgi:hypothetical protein